MRNKSTQNKRSWEKKHIDLKSSLKKCQKSAHRGYKIAKENIRESSKAIKKVSKSLSECLKTIEDGKVRSSGIVKKLRTQLSDVAFELEQLQNITENDLAERKKRLDRFSITLFGRTMSGKSTLMEILTQGDGISIGKGGQRTTRDVRTYNWHGLEVTDVPGIAAFEGLEDEEVAFKSASQADLVLFLVTDDAPQPVEAECLARIRRLGKPVIGICNIKTSIDDEDDLALFLGKPDRSFNIKRIRELLDQFHAFADQHIPGRRVPFVITHLRSRFLAQVDKYKEHHKKLIKASRFNKIESQIVREVDGRGVFLRSKSFIDGAVTPLMDLTNR
ncbi:MAG: GTPase, partial [Bacteroidota bacterium]